MEAQQVVGQERAELGTCIGTRRASSSDDDLVRLDSVPSPCLLPPALSSNLRRRNTPVESISLKGWSSLKDGNIMTLCNTLQHLK